MYNKKQAANNKKAANDTTKEGHHKIAQTPQALTKDLTGAAWREFALTFRISVKRIKRRATVDFRNARHAAIKSEIFEAEAAIKLF